MGEHEIKQLGDGLDHTDPVAQKALHQGGVESNGSFSILLRECLEGPVSRAETTTGSKEMMPSVSVL